MVNFESSKAPFFDASEALEELLEGQPIHTGRKLVFTDKCAAYCALKIGIAANVIMQGFGLSRPTVSHLKHAGDNRYSDVAREFERLGETAFREKYYTDAIHTRLMRIKYDVAQPSDKPGPRGPSQRADKFSFPNYGVFHSKVGSLRIDWLEIMGAEQKMHTGWWFISCQPDGERTKGDRYQGRECNEPIGDQDPVACRRPFLTSSAAHHGALVYAGDRDPK